MQYVHLVFEVLGAVSIVLAAVQASFPNTAAGRFCARWGAVVRKVQDLEVK